MSLLAAHGGLFPLSGSSAAGTDDFNSNSLPSYTQFADYAGTWSISGGFLSESGGEQSILARNGVSFADGEISCVITEAYDAGLVLRLQDNNNYYVATVADASGSSGGGGQQSMRIYRKMAGAYAQVGATALIAFARGTSHVMSFSAAGAALIVKFDGATTISATDSALPAAGLCGVRSHMGPAKFDSFSWPS